MNDNIKGTYYTYKEEELEDAKMIYIGSEPEYYNYYQRIALALHGIFLGRLSDFSDIHSNKKNTGMDLTNIKDKIYLIQTEEDFVDLWYCLGTAKDFRGAFIPATVLMQKTGHLVKKTEHSLVKQDI